MRGFTWLLVVAFAVAGCGGGGGGGTSSVPAVTVTATPTPAPTATATPASAPPIVTTAGASAQNVSFGTFGAGYTGTLGLPVTTSGTGSVTATLSAVAPANVPAVASAARLPRAIGNSPTGLAWVTFVSNAGLTFGSTPSFTFTLPPGFVLGSTSTYVAIYDPTQPNPQWQTLLGPGTITVSGGVTTIAFGASGTTLTFAAGVTYVFVCVTTSHPVTLTLTVAERDAYRIALAERIADRFRVAERLTDGNRDSGQPSRLRVPERQWGPFCCAQRR